MLLNLGDVAFVTGDNVALQKEARYGRVGLCGLKRRCGVGVILKLCKVGLVCASLPGR